MATQVRFYGIKYYASSTSAEEHWWPTIGGTDVTFYDTNCNKIDATASGSRWIFTVPSLPYTIFIKKGGSTSSIYPEAGEESRIYIYTISATEYDDVTPYIYEETDREKGSIWQGYREVLEVYQGETCVYKVKKPKKTNHVFYVGFSTGSGTPTVSVNGSIYSTYHSITSIDGNTYFVYYYPGQTSDDPSTVYVGQEVVWTASADNYKTEGGTIYVTSSDPSTIVQLQQGDNVRILDIIPTPQYSSVYFNNSYNATKRYMATYGEAVNWRVEYYGYDTSSGQITMTQDTSLYVNLAASVRRFIFDVTPAGATIEVSENGPTDYTPISGTVYETTSPTYIYYRISLNGYETITDYAWWNGGDTYIYANLQVQVNTYTVTFNITPSSGNTIYINNSTTPLSGNVYTASENEVVSYRIVNDDQRYAEYSNQTTAIVQDTTIPITLSIKQVTFTVIPEPSDATVTFAVGGTTYVQNSITMDAGTEFSYVVSKTGYTPVSSGTVSIYNSDSTTVTLGVQCITHEFRITPKNSSTENYVFTINNISVPVEYPSEVNYARISYTGNFEDELNWQITADHYYTQSGTYVLVDSEDESYEEYTAISLITKMYSIYAEVTDASANTTTYVQDAVVKIKFGSSGTWQTFNKSTWETDYVTSAAYGVTVYYEVTATGWNGSTGYSGNFVSGQNNAAYYIHASLVKAQCTFTIVPTPSDATVTINGVERKTITVDQGSTISYIVSKTGYNTIQNNSYLVPYQSSITIDASLSTISSNYTLTVNRVDPSTMVVQYAIGDIDGFTPGTLTILSDNTIDVSVNKYVYLLGSDNNVKYADKSMYVYMNSDREVSIDLDRKPRVTFASITPSDATVYVYNSSGSVVSKSNDGYYYFNGSEIGDQFTYTVSKSGYTQENGVDIIGDWESTVTIPAIELVEESCTVTIITDPWNCQITVKDYDTSETLTPDKLDSSTWEVAITKGHRLQYTVSRTQWTTSAPNPNFYTITSDTTIYVNLTCPTTTPLSFECRTAGQIIPVQVGSVGTRQLQYRTIDDVGFISDWQTDTTGFYPSGSFAPITVYPGYTYQFKAKTTVDSYSDPYGDPDSNYCYFKLTNQQGALSGDFRVFGNIKSLLDPIQSNYQSSTAQTTEDWYTYNRMFYGQTALKSARQLILRSTDPRLGAYREMFRGCTNLEAACTSRTSFPEASGNNKLYESMFYGCSSLTNAPTLRNVTDGPYADTYKQMFYNCTNLNKVTWLLTANAPNSTYCSNWLYGVASTGQFVKSSDATWSTPSRSASTIPANWTITT